MFEDFEGIVKKKAAETVSNLSSVMAEPEFAKTAQKFTINGRAIQEKKLLAEGAFGFIWLAEDINSKEKFALKRVICMTDESFKSAMVEKSIMEKLPESPNIVKYYGGLVFKSEERKVVITLMELCPGGNLFDLLQKNEEKGLEESVVLKIAHSVLNALTVLHKLGIIHRDIKIENVLIDEDGEMKICDFGSCTTDVVNFAEVPQADYESVQEKIESFTTPMYRPPEVVDPYLKYRVSTKADLWMLGCTLYTMSYFTHPFVDTNAVGISNGVFRFPSSQQSKYKVSPKMNDFIRNLLTPNPEHRPSAEKMMQILSKWDELPSIPLNQSAKALKREHQEKEKEMQKLNKKVVAHDGDIPLEELKKISEKLKSENKESYEKQSVSFITKKDTLKLCQSNKEKAAPSNNFQKTTPKKEKEKVPLKDDKQKKKSDLGEGASFWDLPSKPSNANNSSAATNKNSFDAFSDVFISNSSQPPQNPNKAANNFEQFFSPTSIVDQSKQENEQPKIKSASSKESMNLLDL